MQNKKQQVPAKAKELPKKFVEVKSWEPNEKASLAEVIGRVFDLQKQFGKNTGQLENIVAGFCWALAKYQVEEVIRGFGEYIQRHSDMPTPADIVAIIDPKPPEKVWDKSVYYKLQQIYKEQGPYGLNNEEYEYIRNYEEQVFKSHRAAS